MDVGSIGAPQSMRSSSSPSRNAEGAIKIVGPEEQHLRRRIVETINRYSGRCDFPLRMGPIQSYSPHKIYWAALPGTRGGRTAEAARGTPLQSELADRTRRAPLRSSDLAAHLGQAPVLCVSQDLSIGYPGVTRRGGDAFAEAIRADRFGWVACRPGCAACSSKVYCIASGTSRATSTRSTTR